MQTIHRRFKHAALAAVIGGLFAFAGVPAASNAADTLSPAVGKPLNAAQTAYRARNYAAALSDIAQAAAVPNKTPYETYMVEEMRGAAAMAAGQTGVAAQAYEALLAGGQVKGAEEQQITATLAGIYFQERNYGKAVQVAQHYLKAGGTDPQMRTLLIQSYYLSNDCHNVVGLLKPGVDADVHAGRVPAEADLQLLSQCAQRTKDDAAYRGALEKLVAYHPNKTYWDDMFAAIRNRQGYSSNLDVDLYRLRRAMGSFGTVEDYMEMTQLSIVAGTTAEAKQVVDQGFSSGVLGHDAEAAREKRLQALAAQRALPGAQQTNPVAPVDAAFNLVFAGKAQDGIAQMQDAIAKGGLDHPDQAQLHLGIAYYMAGQKPKAIQALRAVKGTDGSADIAQLWLLVASK